MALNRNELVQLGKIVAKADPSAGATTYSFKGENFTYEVANETFRREMNEYASTYAKYRENKNLIFSVIEEILDDILPKKVEDIYSQFAEVRTFAQGDKPLFRRKTSSKTRAKQFITRVGLSGIYEVCKLDGQSYEVPTSAYGGAAQVGLEEFLDGRVDWGVLVDIVMEGIDEAIYREMAKALVSAVTSLQSTNKTTQTGFVEAEMDKLLQIADSYGKAEIYCTYEFAATMVPSTGWVSDDMRNQKWNNGYLGNYKTHRVIVLPQSFEDETNTKKVLDPSYAWIIPTGTGEKPIKVAMEGQTIVDEYVNKDRSREIQVYKKIGVGAKITNNICVYKNSSLA